MRPVPPLSGVPAATLLNHRESPENQNVPGPRGARGASQPPAPSGLAHYVWQSVRRCCSYSEPVAAAGSSAAGFSGGGGSACSRTALRLPSMVRGSCVSCDYNGCSDDCVDQCVCAETYEPVDGIGSL